MIEPSTPLMRQYAAIKKEHPNALLFFRLGDFYELFFDDAVVAAKELQITLTSRNKEKGVAIPMCGVPFHAAEGYLAKLLRKGFKVAICEQMEDARMTKQLVHRQVTRVLTPGTAQDLSLDSEENNFLAAIAHSGDITGLAALDLSTGEFRATQFQGENAAMKITEELQQLRPREVLFASSLPMFDKNHSGWGNSQDSSVTTSRSLGGVTETPLDDWVFAPDYAVPLLENQFGVLSLEGFGLSGAPAAACAAGAILHYVRATQRGALEHVDRLAFYDRQDCLVLDAVTVRNLELIEPLFANSEEDATLFRSLDATRTPMGKRFLRSWILRPSIDEQEINSRLDAVDAMVRETLWREELRRSLDGIFDMERLLSRITLETANPRDVLALAASLARLPQAGNALRPFTAQRLAALQGRLDELADVRDEITRTIVEQPPLTFNDGGIIAAGVDAELDELRSLSRSSKQIVAQIEERERQRTGINSLKVKFNSIFGYYIEISRVNLHLAPPDYERKQTLVNAERFTTPELKGYEAKILDAQEKIVEIERRIFAALRATVAAEARRIRQTSMTLAEVDVLASLAHTAANRGYCRPRLISPAAESTSAPEMEIIGGRHPVIEARIGSQDRFVPNDLFMGPGNRFILLITGPNMGGKSTYLRQTAMIVLMAQMGSFVPARSARMGIVDRIFTRIGASDNLARGRSTFMVEMTETAAIVNSATPRSLILLDEMGRGTSTYDGLAIAWATVEYIHSRLRAKTLFATHYHELTELEEQLEGVKNFHVSVKENSGGIVFLRKVEPGAADRSYGVEVAKLAGLPPEIIRRARAVLTFHQDLNRAAGDQLSPPDSLAPAQLTIFTPLSQKIVDRLKQSDPDNLTPIEALNLLHELKKQIQ